MVVVDDVGLITCERCVSGQRARLLIGRRAQGDLAPKTSTWKRKRLKSRFRKKKWKMKRDNEEMHTLRAVT